MSRETGEQGHVVRGVLVWLVVVGGAAALVAAVMLDVLDGLGYSTLIWVPFYVSFVGVGAVILRRVEKPKMGRLFLFVGADVAASLLFSSYAAFAAERDLPGAAWAGIALTVTIWLSLLVFLVLQLFPDGEALSPRWRLLVRATVGVTVIGILASTLSAQEDFTSSFPTLEHPMQVLREPMAGVLFYGAQFASLLLFALSAVSVILRYLRSRGVERLQMKWIATAGGVVAIAFVATALWPRFIEPVIVFAVLMPLVPVSCGIAIMRYRLYEIDRIVSRTTSYALVTGVLIAVYVALVTAVSWLLPDSSSNALAVAAATLAAAALFRPLLSRVQAAVDSRFNRARYDAEHSVQEFADRLRNEVDPDLVLTDLVTVLGHTVQPVDVSLWLRTDPR